MAVLCSACKAKTPDSRKGMCLAKIVADCKHLTDSFSFSRCDPCATKLNQCAWCMADLSGKFNGAPSVPTTKKFHRVQADRDGDTVLGMIVGEQILCEMLVDMYQGEYWTFKSASSGIRLALTVNRRDPYAPQYAWVDFYFDLNQAMPSGVIELQKSAFWGQPGTPFKISVEVK